MADDATLQFYAENAAEYVRHGAYRPSPQLEQFLAALPPGADILELGTGGGHDAAAMLARGFNVTPSDASTALAAEAEHLLKRLVRILAFNALDDVAAYDGVWASASLLHAPASELTDDLSRIHHALRPAGRLVASFKAGDGEGRDQFGRYYNYPSAETLMTHFRDAASWTGLDLSQIDGTGYDKLPTRWLWVTAVK
ncbi:class I SAM-dependent methyltransferase [Devosia sp.]|uniref:class I SAM-dependent methyltransferase n=1 Tax=Devosia sp. TaxID=1871048 RepID=UPI0032651095